MANKTKLKKAYYWKLTSFVGSTILLRVHRFRYLNILEMPLLHSKILHHCDI